MSKTAFELIQELSPSVGLWGQHNFDFHAPHAGAAEEAGELVHALLKAAQGIRGTPAEHKAAAEDALADTIVFLAHLNFKLQRFESIHTVAVPDAQLGNLFLSLGALFHNPNSGAHASVAACLDRIAECLNIDLEKVALSTWEEVSKRDWRKFPKNGLTL